MALQNYTPIRLPPTLDPILRHELLKVDIFLRQLTPFAARVPVFPQGTTSSSVDLTQFLYLPGRSPRQRAFGNVTFSAGTVDQGTALDDSVVRGFALEGSAQTAGSPVTHSVYFQPDNATSTTIVRKWIFPSISSSPTDTFTFAATTGDQTFAGKTITSGVIFVGTNSSKNIFRSTSNSPTTPIQEFTIAPNTGFPGTSSVQSQPTLKLPSLDISVPTTDRHTFMMLHASTTAPFTSGSIAHGNHDGSEMQMLPASTTNGRALRWNNGESIASCSWTNGTTTIFGAFTTANTRPGMRVRGNNGTSVFVDENTMIVTVANGVSITVDTPLVGNAVANVTCQTWGPTWDFELAGVDHGSLTGLTDDDHPQYLYLAGRAGGQVLGSGTHTGANITDLTLEGRLMLGDGLTGVNYTAGRVLDIRGSASNGATFVSIQNTLNTPATGAASGTLTMLLVQPQSPAYTSGSYVFRGLNFTMTGTPAPSGVTVSALTAVFCQATPTEGGDPGSGGTFGSITNYRGSDYTVQGTSNPASRTITATTNGTTALTSAGLFVAPIAAGQVINKADVPARTTIVSITDASNLVMSQAATGSAAGSTSFLPISTALLGQRMLMSARTKPFVNAAFMKFENTSGGNLYIENADILFVDGVPPFNTAGVGVWSVLRFGTAPTLPAEIWAFNISATANSRHAGNFTIGGTATPTAKLFLGAGTTAASSAPLKFTSGTNMTTAEAGAVEFTTDDLFFTITTGAARKAFILDDGTRLTSGRVPFATTNGRLTDDADLTFAADTLTATKIAITEGAVVPGTFTPTLTNVANLAASTAYQCQYMQVGNVVTVSGKVDVDPTLTVTVTQLGISLPIASNIGAEEDCCGTAFAKAIAGQGAAILGDAANNRAQMEWISGDVTNQPMYFSFTYRII